MSDLKELKVTIKNEKVGLPISAELSEYLKQYTNQADIAEASARSGVGTSTIRHLMYRNNSLTEGNSHGIRMLIDQAIKNGMQTVTDASVAVAYLKSIIKPE